MNEIYTEADLMPEASMIPTGSVVSENDLLPVGATPDTRDAVKSESKDSIPMSAAKDIYQGTTGIAGMFNTGIQQAINIANPFPSQNTLVQIGKTLYDSYKAGTLGADTKATIEALVKPVIEDVGAVAEPLMKGDISGAAETVARKPFTYAMDLATLADPAVRMGRGARFLSKEGASLVFGPSTKNISARIANSELIKNARPYTQIAQDIPVALKDIGTKIGKADKDAWATLSKNPADGYSVADVNGLIDIAQNNIGKVIGQADKNAIAVLDGIKKDVSTAYGTANVPPSDIKIIIQKLDDNIDWKSPLSKSTNDALKDLRVTTDMLLKSDNPTYKAAMDPVQRLMEIRSDAMDVLGVKKVNGEYLIPDSTVNKIANLHKGSLKTEAIKDLESFADVTGLDIPTEAKHYRVKELFEKPTTAGSRKTAAAALGGAVIGHATGSALGGAAIGGAAGALLDVSGGKMLGAMIDTTAPALKGINTIGTKIAKLAPEGIAPAILIKGYEQEKKDHPGLDDNALIQVVADELYKDENIYGGN